MVWGVYRFLLGTIPGTIKNAPGSGLEAAGQSDHWQAYTKGLQETDHEAKASTLIRTLSHLQICKACRSVQSVPEQGAQVLQALRPRVQSHL